jgi:hypothetical protein
VPTAWICVIAAMRTDTAAPRLTPQQAQHCATCLALVVLLLLVLVAPCPKQASRSQVSPTSSRPDEGMASADDAPHNGHAAHPKPGTKPHGHECTGQHCHTKSCTQAGHSCDTAGTCPVKGIPFTWQWPGSSRHGHLVHLHF